MRQIWRAGIYLLIVLLSPIIVFAAAVILAIVDAAFFLFGRRRSYPLVAVDHNAASIVIPTWNGRDLLSKFLPAVINATAGNPAHEIIVVDNASEDGTADFLRENFPGVKVLALPANVGFGPACNQGAKAARNDVLVLLNNDMRVEPDFLDPLLSPFADPLVFAVSCQIFLSDPAKRREETGLTRSLWARGRLLVGHVIDDTIQQCFPCSYAGGGSAAFDRHKFLHVGGFDHLFRPFYYEDTDLSYAAWKSGWKVLYQPCSIVYHEHRGTIGRRFSSDFIQSVLSKNRILYCWKNIHDWKMLARHFLACLTTPFLTLLSGNSEGRYTFGGLGRAFLQINDAARARWRARALSAVSDSEAFRRPMGGYYRDRFQLASRPIPDRLHVLFASPYPIAPPVHGGAVFMHETLRQLARLSDIHLLSFVDHDAQLPAQESLRRFCASAQFFVRRTIPARNPSTLLPHAIREFADDEFAWALHRTIYLEQIDIVQLEYTVMSQYWGAYDHIPCFLFEHDVFFQSLLRRMRVAGFSRVGVLEYLRMLRYETRQVRRFSRVQVCSNENARYLVSFVPDMRGRIDSDTRAVIDSSKYEFVGSGREANTILFVGSFRHSPNLEGLTWFVENAFPSILQRDPSVQLVVVGSDPPDSMHDHPNIRILGFVDDVVVPLTRYAVFICPILSGSGLRVKLLEAFATGIPVVSTRIGAEGLAETPGDVCELADSADHFAQATLKLLNDPAYASAMAKRARVALEQQRDSQAATQRLVATYRLEVGRHRPHADTLARESLMAG